MSRKNRATSTSDWLPTVKERHIDDFLAAKEISGRRFIQTWRWFDVFLDKSAGSWDEQVTWTRKAIVAVIDELTGPDLDVCMNVFGQFLPDGLIGVAGALIDTDSGARFYLPAIESMVGGCGYVDSFLNVEYKDGFIDRIFERAGDVLVGSENCLSVFVVPKQHFQEAARCDFGLGDLRAKKLTQSAKTVLNFCRYVILVNNDFDLFRVGTKLDYVDKLRKIFQRLWPDVMGQRK